MKSLIVKIGRGSIWGILEVQVNVLQLHVAFLACILDKEWGGEVNGEKLNGVGIEKNIEEARK